ncbi:MAG TPA: undecaprenyl-phosphate alpha-N-acetylglucosaminyl 1-phosphate transferase [Porticoccaceae bacterium]|nr:undecaprenyl-phosphate alpha-N-acetylglucosaminyl 1-phosphate transferase [Porticoccaceae bacterium]
MELVLTFSTSLLLAIGLIPLCARRALQWQLVDHPSEARKVHRQPIPRIGGICIVASGLVGSAYWLLPLDFADYELASVLVGGIIIAGFGLLDDRFDLGYRVKFLGQILATLPLLAGGVYFQVIPFWGVEPAPVWISMPLTFFFMLGAINAVNLADGLDGLAAGLCGIANCGFLLVAALVAQQGFSQDPVMDIVRICVILATLGAVAGFLPYNFNPASIFMGDAGSLLLGYLCMATVLLFTPDTGAYAPKLVTALLIIYAIPITDTLLAIIRRKAQGKSITAPDNGHIHHLLRRSGFGVKQTVVLLYAGAVVFAVIGVGMVYLDLQWRYMLAVFFPLYSFMMVVIFHYSQNLTLREQLKAEGQLDDRAL